MLFISLLGYLACKWFYGGLYRLDPVNHPINPKTRLALGDVKHIGTYITICGIMALAGSVLLYLYEGNQGVEYYLETYGSGFFSDFWGMISACRWGGILLICIGITAIFVGQKVEGTTVTAGKIETEKIKALLDDEELHAEPK
jgi:hypothetical protein